MLSLIQEANGGSLKAIAELYSVLIRSGTPGIFTEALATSVFRYCEETFKEGEGDLETLLPLEGTHLMGAVVIWTVERHDVRVLRYILERNPKAVTTRHLARACYMGFPEFTLTLISHFSNLPFEEIETYTIEEIIKKGILSRETILQDPGLAFQVALHLEGPREDTRTATCKSPEWALKYARKVDKRRHPETWEAVQKDISKVAWYPDLEVTEEIKDMFLNSPDEAHFLASRFTELKEDKQFKAVIERNPRWAVEYGKPPEENSRKASCAHPSWAATYAYVCDERLQKDTWNASKMNLNSLFSYKYVLDENEGKLDMDMPENEHSIPDMLSVFLKEFNSY